ncbi:hypothetical protein ACFOGJ_14765 [Marinibaculum pumilum]|uniref:SGNH/GDSL hydrolase family protein n=1 Tax=Marinibaculum pumilum TaxID=1766165 RepID=A0ABV7L266_9PROT
MATRGPARGFLAAFFGGLLVLFGGVLAVTAGIDPYGLSPLDPDLGSLNSRRMERRQLDRMIKPIEAIERQPKTLLLGTSRVRQGFAAAGFDGTGLAPVYNLGLNFSSLDESTALLETILPYLPSVKTIVFEFNFVHYHLPKGPHGVPVSTADLLHDLATAFLSTDALAASVRTVLQNRNYTGHYYWIHPDGMMVMSPASMLQDIENFYANVVTPFHVFQSGPVQAKILSDLRAICDRYRIDCIFAVLPYLPNDLAYYDETGNFASFVQAKRELLEAGFPVLDMTLFNPVTAEPLSDGMTYWTDVNHFKPLVGGYIADRLAGRENPSIPESFGIWLTEENFAPRMAEWRAGLDAWKAAHPEAVSRIRATLARKASVPPQ